MSPLPAVAAFPLAATASSTPSYQYLNDTAGTLFTFTVKNTGATMKIGAVEVQRPSTSWTITSCPSAPVGWTTTRTSATCRYTSAATTADDLAIGASSSAFQLRATTAPGGFDRPGTWSVRVYQAPSGTTTSAIASAAAPGALAVTAYSFEVLDAVLVATPPTQGTPCPTGARSGISLSLQNVVICGRNRTNATLMPLKPQAVLGGTFISSQGTFTSTKTIAPGSSSVVLGTFVGARLGNSAGTGKTIVVRIGESSVRLSPSTTLGGYEAINAPPSANAQSVSLLEDSSAPITLTGSDPEAQPLTFTIVSPPAHGTLTGAPPNVSYQPAANYFGPDSFQFRVNDGVLDSPPATVSITVIPVNDAPSFVKGPDVIVNEDAVASLPGWATAISPGPLESTQTVAFQLVSTSNPSLFAVAPAISPTGTLTFTAAPNQIGMSSVTIYLKDNGGTANGGVDSSPSQSFDITVAALNDPPTFTSGGNVTVLEDSGPHSAAWATAISPGPPDEAGQSVTFDVTGNTNPALFSVQPTVAPDGTLDFTPLGNAYGSSNITVVLRDNGPTGPGDDNSGDPVTFSITVTGVNDEPTFDLPASPNQLIVQDSGPQTVPGFATNITAGPNEASQVLTFVVTNDDNALFVAQPDIDETTGDLTYTSAVGATGTATVSVVLTDDGGTANGGDDTSATKQFTIEVEPPNATPSGITLTPDNINEGNTSGDQVGTLTTTDADAGDTHTYTLVSGVGDTDNLLFSIVGDKLFINTVTNYETKSVYSIRVQTDDGNINGTFAEAITVDVNDLNETPTDISLSPADIDENTAPNTAVGVFTTTDPDTGQTHTYTLENSGCAGSFPDNAAFSIVGSQLIAPSGFNFEADDSYTICVRTADDGAGNLSFEKSFVVTVNDVNDAPSDIALVDTHVAENAGANASVGTLSATDQDTGQTHTFTLVAGCAGGPFPDNAAFNISGTDLRATSSLDFETKSSYTICVRVEDDGLPALSFDEQFVITVDDVNEAPTDIALTATSITENTAAPAVIGGLSETDPDTGQTHTFTLEGAGCGGGPFPDNAAFDINGTDLRATSSPNFEVKSSYTICLRVTDDGVPTLSYDEQFVITVIDANDAPTAAPDSYGGVIGNTLAVRGVAGSGPHVVLTGNLLTFNDSDEDAISGTFPSTITLTAETVTSTGGGTATINADGSFTFLPGIGDKNQNDTFSYQISDGLLTSVGTVTLTIVDQLVWYVNNTAPAPATPTGRSDAPLTALTLLNGPDSATDVDATGDHVFVYQGTSTYTGGLTLEHNQRLWGQPFGLVVNNGAGDVTLVAAGGSNPTISGGVGLALDNNVQGVTLGSHSGFALSGNGIGSAVVGQATGAQVIVNNTGTGGAVSLATGNPTVILGSATSSGGANAISLNTLGGSFTVNGGALSGASGNELLFSTGTANVTIAATVSSSAGGAVSIGSWSAGTVTISGSVTVSAGPGISLSTNTGGTINFTGLLSLTTGSSTAFTATGGGTVSATNTSSTITTTTGTALNIANTTIGSSGVKFLSISANGAANGIVLNNTGASGGLSVLGSGTAGSGGTMQSTTGDSISLTSTRDVSIARMNILGPLGSGINGSSVTNFTLSDSTVSNSGDDVSGALDESGIKFANLLGTASLTNVTVADSIEDNVRIVNTSGTLTQLTISGCIIRDTETVSPGNNGLLIQADGTASITADVTTTSFLRNRGNGVQAVTNGSGVMNIEVGSLALSSGGTLQDNNIGVNLAHNSSGSFAFNVRNAALSAPTKTTAASPINVNKGGLGTGLMSGNIEDNTITNNNSLVGAGIRIEGNGNPGTLTVNVDGNTISQVAHRGISVVAVDGNTPGNVVNATIRNNSITLTNAASLDGIYVAAGGTPSTDTTTVCADIANNTSTTVVTSFGIRVWQRNAGTTFRLEGYAGSATSDAAVATFLSGTNAAATASAAHDGAGFVAPPGGTCPLP